MQNHSSPFFSIGITTYNRKEMLHQAVSLLLSQSFADFEIIIGNDYIEEPLTYDALGIYDSRIVIVNHKKNMGELENMNHILKISKGKYFTWQYDDDPCSPNILDVVYDALKYASFPKCLYTSFKSIYGGDKVGFDQISFNQEKVRTYSGSSFLNNYLSGSLKILGCCGFFNKDYLMSILGAPKLTNGKIALYSEYGLIVKLSLLDKVAFVDEPLIISRNHSESWSIYNQEVDEYREAGLNLLRESLPVLHQSKNLNKLEGNLTSLISLIVGAFIAKGIQNKRFLSLNRDIEKYIDSISDVYFGYCDSKNHSICSKVIVRIKDKIFLFKLKAFLKLIVPVKFYGVLKNISKSFNG